MGSVLDTVKCPNCGGEFNREFYYKTGEEWGMCSRCGKFYSHFFERDKDYKLILDENGKPKEENKSCEGFGVIAFWFKNGSGQVTSLGRPIDDEIKKGFYNEINNNPEIDKEKTYFTYVDAETKEVKAEYGKVPLLLEELEKIWAEKKDG